MLRQYRLKDYKFRLIIWVLALSVIGVLLVGSARADLQTKQIIGLVMGIVLMVIVSLIDYNWVANLYGLEYLFGIALLILVLIPGIGTEVNGARRWIDIKVFQFQPTDVMKIILIVFFAKFFAHHEEDISKFRTILKALILAGIPFVLILREPDLSSTIVCVLLFCGLFFSAGLSYKIIGSILLVCVPGVIIALSLVLQPDQTLIDQYQQNRILAWLHPEDYPDIARQQLNSMVALGSGQLYGKGLNNNVVASVKNGNFLSEPQTDFIFSIAGEELGFLGCCVIIIIELLIAVECVNIGRNARDRVGMLIGCGMGILIFFQSFINISVATGLLPNTGLPLPFVSYGLTSLVSFCIGIGLVLNVGLQSRKYERGGIL